MKRSNVNSRNHRRLFIFAAWFSLIAALCQIAIGQFWPDLMVLRNGLALTSAALWSAVLVISLRDRRRRP